ncbi:MAG: NADAR family protein [Alphaproteobacteria bacterium]|nr:NADAR family protein [Alphaproteobacteria bacterium]
MNSITNFAEEQNQFLANIYPERVSFTYDGIEYRNFETAYQSQKMQKIEDRYHVAKMHPHEAKAYANTRLSRKGWNKPFTDDDKRPSELCTCLKDKVMYDLLLIKFSNPKLRAQLLATGDAFINKENNQGEIYWGTCQGVGQGKIGKMLMEIRTRLA